MYTPSCARSVIGSFVEKHGDIFKENKIQFKNIF